MVNLGFVWIDECWVSWWIFFCDFISVIFWVFRSGEGFRRWFLSVRDGWDWEEWIVEWIVVVDGWFGLSSWFGCVLMVLRWGGWCGVEWGCVFVGLFVVDFGVVIGCFLCVLVVWNDCILIMLGLKVVFFFY